jgi:hypothetical protein
MDEAVMKTNLLRALAVLALIAPLGMVQAQEVQLASHAELNDLYARLAELESRIAASNVSGCGCADAVGNGCDDYCDDCCGCPGFVGGVEFLWLKAFNSNTQFGNFNYEDGFRWWLGYQGAGGLGARIRGFAWGKTVANATVDINTTDFEIYDSVQLGCNWDVIIGGGLRYTDATFGTLLFQEVAAAPQIFGTGPVVTAELYRHVSDRAALFVIARESIVAGDGNTTGFPPAPSATDDTMFISELQLGGQLHREYNGGLLFARLAWEAQYYDDTADILESVTLMGIGASVGLMR